MKIAIMGTRGIPANYGGFETFAEELSTRLVKRGHEITVYCRASNYDYSSNHLEYKGVKLIVLPTIKHKYLDTVFHTFLSVLYDLFKDHRVLLICNSANSLFSVIPRFRGKKIVLNVDGLEWKRKKWNKAGKWFYRFSEILATFFPNAIVSDAEGIREYYLNRFKKDSTFIPYGAPTRKEDTKEILEKLGVRPKGYALYVSRLEPENNAHLVVKAFEKVKTDLKLIIVGDAPYSQEYIDKLKSTKDPRIIFTGYVFGRHYRELQSNAYFYIQATEVGGTHPALLEAMGFGNCVLANDVPEHYEVLGDAGILFSTKIKDDLTNKMQYLFEHPEAAESYREKAVERVRKKYSWEGVTDSYESLFKKLSHLI